MPPRKSWLSGPWGFTPSRRPSAPLRSCTSYRLSYAESLKATPKRRHLVDITGHAKNAARTVNGVIPLSNTFDRFDRDGSGGIDIAELRTALRYLGMNTSNSQAENILRQYDSYPDNSIDVKEFASLVRDLQLLLTFDKNGDGTLDAKELHPALHSLGLNCTQEHADGILSHFDADNSGTIDLGAPPPPPPRRHILALTPLPLLPQSSLGGSSSRCRSSARTTPTSRVRSTLTSCAPR